MSQPPGQRQQRAVAELLRVANVVEPLAARFDAAGEALAVVGGWVRDTLLGRQSDEDLDFATSAHPDKTEQLLDGWADTVWAIGREFGTIGARKGDVRIEVTTYRSDTYAPDSRKPAVDFGDTLEGDLSRRDFTVNAMAVLLPARTFVDPYGGLDDLAAKVLRTPSTAEQSFSDDPLRMMRAARFAGLLGFEPVDDVVAATRDMADRIAIVSAERVSDELTKLVCSPAPRRGLSFMVSTGLADHVLPELPALRLERDEHHRHKDVYEHTLTVLEQTIGLESRLPGGGPDLVARLAALLHDIGKPRTRRFGPEGSVTFHHHDVVGAKLARRRLRALRFPNEVTDSVAQLVELHLRFHGYGGGE